MSSSYLIVVAVLMVGLAVAKAAPAGELLVYIGTTPADPDAKTAGIYACRLDPATGALSEPAFAAHVRRPSWLAADAKRSRLYACDETVDPDGQKHGAVMGFAVDPASGKLTPINEEASGGVGPCFVEVDPAGRAVLVANYASGSVALLPIDAATGKLSAPSSVHQYEGTGPNAKRQAGPHAHCIRVDPGGKFALSCDLGTDRVMIYKLEGDALTPNDPPFAKSPPGAGPRHIAFAPDGKLAYVCNEMGGSVTTFAWGPAKGVLRDLQTISTLPADFSGTNSVAEIALAPGGKFLYVSNRGHDSIACFAVDPSTGQLTARARTPSGGKTPRHFAIDPTGKFMIVGNQGSSELVVLRVDPQSGTLNPTDVKVGVPSPTCVRFWSGPLSP